MWTRVFGEASAPYCAHMLRSRRPRAPRPAPRFTQKRHVYVGPSKITGAGMGLFARKALPRGTIIGNYKKGSIKMDADEFKAAFPHGRPTHVWSHSKKVFYCAGPNTKCVAGFANRGPAGVGNNTTIYAPTGDLVVTAKKGALRGEEILVAYGNKYRIIK
jgi:hypothetical protein